MKEIPNYKFLKAWKFKNRWYIIDCTEGNGDPYRNAIGPNFESYGLLVSYVENHYVASEWN